MQYLFGRKFSTFSRQKETCPAAALCCGRAGISYNLFSECFCNACKWLYDGLNGCKIGLIAISPMYRFHQQQSGIIQTFYVPTHRTQVEPKLLGPSPEMS